jgi:hypothetical protein
MPGVAGWQESSVKFSGPTFRSHRAGFAIARSRGSVVRSEVSGVNPIRVVLEFSSTLRKEPILTMKRPTLSDLARGCQRSLIRCRLLASYTAKL